MKELRDYRRNRSSRLWAQEGIYPLWVNGARVKFYTIPRKNTQSLYAASTTLARAYSTTQQNKSKVGKPILILTGSLP